MFKNSIWNLFNYLFPVFVSIVSIPIYMKHLGSEIYGLWIWAVALIQSLNVTSIGLNDATIKYISESKDDLCRLNKEAKKIFIIYLVFGLLLSLILVIFNDTIAYGIFNVDKSNKEISKVLIRIMSFSICPNLLLGYFVCIFQAMKNYKIVSIANNTRITLQFTFSVCLLLAGYNVISLGFVFLINTILLNIIYYLVLKNKYSLNFFIRFKSSSKVSFYRKYFRFGIYSWFAGLGNLSLGTFDKLIIGRLLGPTVLAYYSIPQMIFQKLHGMNASLMHVVFPYISYNKNFQSLYSNTLIGFGILINSIITSSFVIFVFPQIRNIFELWIGVQFFEHITLSSKIQLIFIAITTLNIVPYYYLLGIGKVRINAIVSFTCGFGSIIAILVLSKFYGFMGAILGSGVYMITMFLYCFALNTKKSIFYISIIILLIAGIDFFLISLIEYIKSNWPFFNTTIITLMLCIISILFLYLLIWMIFRNYIINAIYTLKKIELL